jgi:hypothetical protein
MVCIAEQHKIYDYWLEVEYAVSFLLSTFLK